MAGLNKFHQDCNTTLASIRLAALNSIPSGQTMPDHQRPRALGMFDSASVALASLSIAVLDIPRCIGLQVVDFIGKFFHSCINGRGPAFLRSRLRRGPAFHGAWCLVRLGFDRLPY